MEGSRVRRLEIDRGREVACWMPMVGDVEEEDASLPLDLSLGLSRSQRSENSDK